MACGKRRAGLRTHDLSCNPTSRLRLLQSKFWAHLVKFCVLKARPAISRGRAESELPSPGNRYALAFTVRCVGRGLPPGRRNGRYGVSGFDGRHPVARPAGVWQAALSSIMLDCRMPATGLFYSEELAAKSSSIGAQLTLLRSTAELSPIFGDGRAGQAAAVMG